MAGAEGEAEAPRLSELLDGGWRLYEEVENTSEPSGSNPVQVKVKRGMKQLEEALTMVEQLHLFRYSSGRWSPIPRSTLNGTNGFNCCAI